MTLEVPLARTEIKPASVLVLGLLSPYGFYLLALSCFELTVLGLMMRLTVSFVSRSFSVFSSGAASLCFFAPWDVIPFGIKNYALSLHWLVPELVAHSFLNCSSQLMLVEKFEESFTSSAAIGLGSAMA